MRALFARLLRRGRPARLDQVYKPIFGKLMKPVHPFDWYDLMAKKLRDQPWPAALGITGIPIMQPDGQCYLAEATIREFSGQMYLITTTVPRRIVRCTKVRTSAHRQECLCHTIFQITAMSRDDGDVGDSLSPCQT